MRYTAYADDILIHDSASVNPAMHAIDPNVVIQENAAGTFSFTLTKDNPGYNAIQRKITTIYVKQDGKTIWSGRVNSENENFWKQRTFNCEGALAFLNDINQPLHVYEHYSMLTFLQAIIAIHNSKVSNNRKINLGYVTVADMDDQFEYKTEYKSTWECFKESIFDRLGGHVRIRYVDGDPIPRLDYVKDYTVTSSQQIEFGMNLLDFTKNWDVTDLATVIIPLGKQLEEEVSDGIHDRTNVASVNNGSIYVENTAAVATYGRIERIVEFNEVDDPSTLLNLANIYKQNQQFDEMQLEINALDLHYLNSEISSFKLFDQVRCISTPHGLDKKFPITEINIPLDSPERVVYKMGASTQKNTLSGVSLAQNKNILQQIANMPSFTNLLEVAKRNASEILNARTVGYVTIVEENEESQALVISDTPDWLDSERLWKFNMNGLGYSSDGGETYDLAITMDGHIVADFVHTGILSDGFGLNYWNLSTGEFSLSYNTAFTNQTGNSITIVDVATLAQQGVNTATKANNKQVGATNILNGTNKNLKILTTVNGSSWSNSNWDGCSTQTSGGKFNIVDISDCPNPAVVKAVDIEITANGSDIQSFITQRNISVVANQVYVISCYAKSVSGNGKIIIGSKNTDGTNSNVNTADITQQWKRYSYVFKATKNNILVIFGIKGSRSNKIRICGMKMERGNSASDWSESEKDTYNISTTYSTGYTDNKDAAMKTYSDNKDEAIKTYSKQYTDTISKNDRTFTENQRIALDESYTQYKVLYRLTNGFAAKGIYLKNNQLYMNASYVRTGTLDAGIVKAGILTDARGNNKWNMTTGYLYTKNMEAVNIQANGKFQCGSDYKIVLDAGKIIGYQGSTQVGSISPTANTRDVDTGAKYQGIQIRGKGIIDLRSPKIAVLNADNDGISIYGCTKNIEYQVIEKIEDRGNGSIGYTWRKHGFKIINGIITAIW